ncbi:hypothetical protein HOD05_00405 [Candidatus Woesearchaeota archaeon]|nr:hypothetical protein [Candidatus Woesearchaeota archaeon]MBT4150870.1 hypothetical protein [Candidatus Woesearchaeota archaeon]MBT4246883.1 hypothetical protein [Candidatus Woesearchaeota archaeon]MBT4433660.1 hypothetical protein [Candidatus Woesearchaeota archaeon]
MDLEQTLGQVNGWFGGKFSDKYTSDFANALKAEIDGTVSSDLQPDHSEDIVNYFGRDNILEVTSAFFAASYVIAKKILEEVQGSDDTLNSEDQRVLDTTLGAYSRTVRFVEGLSQHSELTPELMDAEFTQVYGSVEDFSNAYVSPLKLFAHEVTRNKRKGQETRLHHIPAILQKELDKTQTYSNLLLGESVRVQEQFLPRVFDLVLRDMYR